MLKKKTPNKPNVDHDQEMDHKKLEYIKNQIKHFERDVLSFFFLSHEM
jgi:hypothetical protein